MSADVFILLAPGESMNKALAKSFRGQRVGVVGNCFELAPWAEFLVSTDEKWWRAHPKAMQFRGRKLSSTAFANVDELKGGGVSTSINSGVLALEGAKQAGATTIHLHGFDMHGTHFFGPYKNGLANTPAHRREVHQAQYQTWARNNPSITVINCTPGSALRAYPYCGGLNG